MGIQVRGQKKLKKYLKKMANPEEVFDDDFKKVARQGIRSIVEDTPKMTGNTARGWTNPKRLAQSKYVISNDIKTQDKKHLMVNILDKGRGVVKPKKAKRLYIPLTEKGRAKKLGAKIPENLIYGIDYIFAKKSKATKALKFIDKEEERAAKQIVKLMLKRIEAL